MLGPSLAELGPGRPSRGATGVQSIAVSVGIVAIGGMAAILFALGNSLGQSQIADCLSYMLVTQLLQSLALTSAGSPSVESPWRDTAAGTIVGFALLLSSARAFAPMGCLPGFLESLVGFA